MLIHKAPDCFVQSVEKFWQKEFLPPFVVIFIFEFLERIYSFALVNAGVNNIQLCGL